MSVSNYSLAANSFPIGCKSDGLGYVWTVGHDSNNVYVVNATTGSVAATITGDCSSSYGGFVQDGSGHILVANAGNSSVSVFNTAAQTYSTFYS